MPIFRVKSVKIYTGQKKFTRVYPWDPWQIWGMTIAFQSMCVNAKSSFYCCRFCFCSCCFFCFFFLFVFQSFILELAVFSSVTFKNIFKYSNFLNSIYMLYKYILNFLKTISWACCFVFSSVTCVEASGFVLAGNTSGVSYTWTFSKTKLNNTNQ